MSAAEQIGRLLVSKGHLDERALIQHVALVDQRFGRHCW